MERSSTLHSTDFIAGGVVRTKRALVRRACARTVERIRLQSTRDENVDAAATMVPTIDG
jgi:hypothetical protein